MTVTMKQNPNFGIFEIVFLHTTNDNYLIYNHIYNRSDKQRKNTTKIRGTGFMYRPDSPISFQI